MNKNILTRRQALESVGAILATTATGMIAAEGQTTPVSEGRSPGGPQRRLAPRADLVNTLEYEEQAKRQLAPDVYARVAGGSRTAFDRITLRPKMMVSTLDMDLSVTIFGDKHFAPIIVGPIADQRRFHVDAELATMMGASAARASVVLSSHSSVPVSAALAEAKTPSWFQVFAAEAAASAQIRNAVSAGCKVVCITIGVLPPSAGAKAAVIPAPIDWAVVRSLVRGAGVPVLVKGITTPATAALAIQQGALGLIVSDYGGTTAGSGGGRGAQATEPTILALPKIIDAVGGKVPVLVDGSFRRGTDILKALAFGAKSVLIGRPVMWGLAAYGSEGVQGVVEMLQTDLARYMGMCGRPTIATLDATVVKLHGVTKGV